jgi:hypothetical protein
MDWNGGTDAFRVLSVARMRFLRRATDCRLPASALALGGDVDRGSVFHLGKD